MKKAFIIIGAVFLLGIGWYIGSPFFFDTIVDEKLPTISPEITDIEKEKIQKIEQMTSEEIDALPEKERMEVRKMMEEIGKKMPDTIADETMQSPLAIQRMGNFKDADSVHRGSGKATIFTLPDGKNILRFEDFSVTNGTECLSCPQCRW
jgi:hypothetical protein